MKHSHFLRSVLFVPLVASTVVPKGRMVELVEDLGTLAVKLDDSAPLERECAAHGFDLTRTRAF